MNNWLPMNSINVHSNHACMHTVFPVASFPWGFKRCACSGCNSACILPPFLHMHNPQLTISLYTVPPKRAGSLLHCDWHTLMHASSAPALFQVVGTDLQVHSCIFCACAVHSGTAPDLHVCAIE